MALFSEPMRCKELWETNTNLLLTTIVESRHHAITITPFLVSDGGGGGAGGGEGASGKGLRFTQPWKWQRKY